jgi:hypothetical protein
MCVGGWVVGGGGGERNGRGGGRRKAESVWARGRRRLVRQATFPFPFRRSSQAWVRRQREHVLRAAGRMSGSVMHRVARSIVCHRECTKSSESAMAGRKVPDRRPYRCCTAPCFKTLFGRSTVTELHTPASWLAIQSRTTVNSTWSLGLRNRSNDSQKSCSTSPASRKGTSAGV